MTLPESHRWRELQPAANVGVVDEKAHALILWCRLACDYPRSVSCKSSPTDATTLGQSACPISLRQERHTGLRVVGAPGNLTRLSSRGPLSLELLAVLRASLSSECQYFCYHTLSALGLPGTECLLESSRSPLTKRPTPEKPQLSRNKALSIILRWH